MFDPFPLTPEDEGFEPELDEALASQLYHRGKPAVLSFLPVIFLLYLLLKDVHPRPNSLYWAFSVVVATVSLRLGIVLMSERIKTRFPDPKARIRIYALNSFLVGLGLASINVFSAPAITPEQAGILAVVATGLNSVAIVSMASSPMAYLCYMVPNVGSLVLMLALGPPMAHRGLFYTLILAYMSSLVLMVAYVHHSLRSSILMGLRLKEMALRDSLTRLRNRRYLSEFMQEEGPAILRTWAPAQGQMVPRSLGFIMLDIDHFKHVNDTYGHAGGDAVLVQVAERMRAAARKPDLLIRWGGEEFVVVARDIDPVPPSSLAERLRQAVEEEPFSLPSGERIRCTCSLGYSLFPFAGAKSASLGWEQVLSVADACLYEAKQRGRNQTVGISLGEIGEAQLKDLPHLVEEDLQAAERAGLVRLIPSLLEAP